MNVSIKKISIILFGFLLITGCGDKDQAHPEMQSEEKSLKKLEGVDIKFVLENSLPDINAPYSAPDPLMIKKVFEPCNLEGNGADMKGSCSIYADSSFLIDENPEHDTKVDITTNGPRTMVSFIQFESKHPNRIHLALNEEYYKQVKIECTDKRDIERIGTWELRRVSLKNKKDFVVAINKNISASSGWGILRIYLDGTSLEKACEDIGIEESTSSLAKTDMLRPELKPNSELTNNNIKKPHENFQNRGNQQQIIRDLVGTFSEDDLARCGIATAIFYGNVISDLGKNLDSNHMAVTKDLAMVADMNIHILKYVRDHKNPRDMDLFINLEERYSNKFKRLSVNSISDEFKSCIDKTNPLVRPLIASGYLKAKKY
ncbi:hypothetical protein [Candidatus Methylopumilus universalis]|uniref:hypothetical protein n=1 Tax=Candidatus Methylopumilus universalis TaxID=2588536 RepID=UPI003BEEE905